MGCGKVANVAADRSISRRLRAPQPAIPKPRRYNRRGFLLGRSLDGQRKRAANPSRLSTTKDGLALLHEGAATLRIVGALETGRDQPLDGGKISLSRVRNRRRDAAFHG
ncbi:MAG: hypothetical protein QOK29_4899 [Rhodospirillaceae bacterium]|nr:hypothetical protein [Rhodospirillaceae bacterium]